MINLKEMKPDIRYRVATEDSDDDLLQVGDAIHISMYHATLSCTPNSGAEGYRLERWVWWDLKNKVEIDTKYYSKLASKAADEMDAYNEIIRKAKQEN